MFNLSSILIDAEINSVNLSLFLNGAGGDIIGEDCNFCHYQYPADTIGVYQTSDASWTELGITWKNKPDFDPTPSDKTSFITFGHYFPFPYTNVYKFWDLTRDVIEVLKSVKKLTITLKFEDKKYHGYAVFDSKEGTHIPKLNISYNIQSTPTPRPSPSETPTPKRMSKDAIISIVSSANSCVMDESIPVSARITDIDGNSVEGKLIIIKYRVAPTYYWNHYISVYADIDGSFNFMFNPMPAIGSTRCDLEANFQGDYEYNSSTSYVVEITVKP